MPEMPRHLRRISGVIRAAEADMATIATATRPAGIATTRQALDILRSAAIDARDFLAARTRADGALCLDVAEIMQVLAMLQRVEAWQGHVFDLWTQHAARFGRGQHERFQ